MSDVDGVRAPYEYAGLTITPGIMRELMPFVVTAGEAIQRVDLVQRLVDEHIARGGEPSSVNPISQAKKCLRDMATDGHVVRLSRYGYWRYVGPEGGDHLPPVDESRLLASDGDEPFEVHHTSGVGAGSLYAYYFPAYLNPFGAFPIKVGMSAGPYQARIASQLGTSNPELPVVHRVHRTDRPSVLERYVHSALTIQGHWMDEAPGTEWFMTRPEQIDHLLRAVGELGDDETEGAA